jgi:hypothetical protein
MTRAKTKPTMRKPVLDAEGILRFAAQGVSPAVGDSNRFSLTLMLKPEAVSRLQAEASRKEKTIEQIVEKLVAKHLDKH